MVNNKVIFLLVLLCSMLASCSLTKRLADDDLVYMGTDISITDEENKKSVTNFDLAINAIPEPGTRTGIGNIYTGIYNIYEKTGDEGFKNWVKNRVGEAPKLFENSKLKTTEAQLSYFLNGKGYFTHNVACDSTLDDRKVFVTCDVKLGERYKIDSVIFPIDSTYASLKLDDRLKRAIIKEGAWYDRDRLDYERSRLAKLAGDIGFANFGAENVFFYVDTTAGDHKIDLYTEILTPTDSTFHTRYVLDSILIYPNYTINNHNEGSLKKIPVRAGIAIMEREHYLDHGLIDRLVLSETGKYYNRTNERKSINRLLDLGLFRYINIDNEIKKGDGKIDSIIQHIYITPERIQSISGEVEVNNRSGNFLGTGASVSYKHKNIFGHAESLTLGLSGAVEAQFGDELSFINSSDVNVRAELAFPRFIVPFFDVKESINFVPRTLVNTNYTYQRRIQYYTLESAAAKYGYRWRESSRKLHEFYPININQVLVRDKTLEFQDLLDEDARLSSAFDDVLIAGLQYYFTYSNQANTADRKYKYFRGELETSGNLLGLVSGASSDDPSSIAGLNFAQFTKVTLDYRRYFPVGSSDIATRVILGSGFAYGNSKELPYIKQYIIGGSNSLRGFRLRGLGPGDNVTDPSLLDPFATQFVDQTGDIKLEMNVEYRFPVFNFIKGALFVDAGNIWLINSDTQPDGNFAFDTFYKQIGVSTGLGIRLDFNFFLIRMDLGVPMRSPAFGEGFKWRAREIDLLDRDWRSDNLRYNLGIGYPF